MPGGEGGNICFCRSPAYCFCLNSRVTIRSHFGRGCCRGESTSRWAALSSSSPMSEVLMDTAVHSIPGYDYGDVARSPVTLEELHKLEASASFDSRDKAALAR